MFDNIISKLGDKKYRIRQFEHAVYRELIDDVSGVTVFPKELREILKNENLFMLQPEEVHKSDNTYKVLFKTKDGHKIESVLMKHKGRNTVCVSSQIGCPCACKFCATGTMGFTRNLETQEIIEQVLFWNRQLKKDFLKSGVGEWKSNNPPSKYRVRNIVFMGMGEPLLNFENVFESIGELNNDHKFGIGQRRITVSTVGITPMIKKFAQKDMQINLALSLHAPNDKLRSEIMPINNKYPLPELLLAIWDFSGKTGRRVFFEYTVMKGINDSPKTIRELGNLLKGKLAHVNFIPVNENPQTPLFKKPEISDIKKLQEILLNEFGVVSTIRQSFGEEISGACGQLAAKSQG